MRQIVLLVIGAVLYSSVLFAGQYLTNETGEMVYGLRVVFSEPVTITAFGDIFKEVFPQEEAREFLFSGGEVQSWEGHWFNYEPASTEILAVEWLTDLSGVSEERIRELTSPSLWEAPDELVPISHEMTSTYPVLLQAAQGETLGVQVTRTMSVNVIPAWVEYSMQIPDGFKFTHQVDGPVMPTDSETGGTLMSALLIDDFSDIDLVSNLGTKWELTARDSRISKYEVIRDVFGHGLICNGNNSLSLSLSSIDGSEYQGLYMNMSGSGLVIVNTKINNSSAHKTIRLEVKDESSETTPEVFLLPFSNFEGLNNRDLDSLLIRMLTQEQYQGITIYDIGFYKKVKDGLNEPNSGGQIKVRHAFPSNSKDQVMRFYLSDGETLFSYEEEIAFPIFAEREILLDGTQVQCDEPSEMQWVISNSDPNETKNLASEAATFQLQYPDVIDVTFSGGVVSPEDANSRMYYKVVSPRGDILPIMGVTLAAPSPSNPELLAALKQDMKLSSKVGWGLITWPIIWNYGWPENWPSNPVWALRPYYYKDMWNYDPRGFTIKESDIDTLVEIANKNGLLTSVGMTQYPLDNNPELSEKFDDYGTGPNNQCWKCNKGFLYGDGEGYLNMLNFYSSRLKEVDIVMLGAESDLFFKRCGSTIREFFLTALEGWKSHAGLVSYAIVDYDPHSILNMPDLLFDVEGFGFPYSHEGVGLVTVTEYQPLALPGSSSIEDMHDRALERFQLFKKFSDTFNKPFRIQDLVVYAYDGVLFNTPGDWGKAEEVGERDDFEQISYYSAWLRALYDNRKDGGEWIHSINMGNWINSARQGYYGSEIWMLGDPLNLKARMLDVFSAWFNGIEVDQYLKGV